MVLVWRITDNLPMFLSIQLLLGISCKEIINFIILGFAYKNFSFTCTTQWKGLTGANLVNLLHGNRKVGRICY